MRDGDIIRLDAEAGTLEAKVDAAEWEARSLDTSDLSGNQHGMGRELFSLFRNAVGTAEEGGATFGLPPIFEKEKATV